MRILVLFAASVLALTTIHGSSKLPSPWTPSELAAFKRAADAGSVEAMVELAAWGDGTEEGGDFKPLAEVRWLTLAAEGGLPEAYLWLGKLHQGYPGFFQDWIASEQALRNAAANGVEEAHFSLGVLLFSGWRRSVDGNEGVSHFRRAADSGYRPAQRVVSDLYALGVVLQRDMTEALRFAELAAAPRAALAGDLKSAVNRYRKWVLLNDEGDANRWHYAGFEKEIEFKIFDLAAKYLRALEPHERDPNFVRWTEIKAAEGSAIGLFLNAVTRAPDTIADPTEDARVHALLRDAADEGLTHARAVRDLTMLGMPVLDALHFVISVPDFERFLIKNSESNRHLFNAPPRLVGRPAEPSHFYVADRNSDRGVTLRFTVTTEGIVENVRVSDASDPDLTPTAIAELESCTFEPGVREGRPEAMQMQFTLMRSDRKE